MGKLLDEVRKLSETNKPATPEILSSVIEDKIFTINTIMRKAAERGYINVFVHFNWFDQSKAYLDNNHVTIYASRFLFKKLFKLMSILCDYYTNEGFEVKKHLTYIKISWEDEGGEYYDY